MTTRSVLRIGMFAAGAAAACVWAPTALADDRTVQVEMGSPADAGVGQSWTVTDLRPSADAIAFAPAGTLWEASVTAAPAGGGVPVVPGFSARSDQDNYPVLWTVPSQLGVSPAPVAAGQTATGKLYFDVTGSAPTSVVYSSSGQDTAVWVPPAPAPSSAPSYESPAPAWGGGGSAGVTPQVPAAAPSAPAPAVSPAAPPATPISGSAGTPVPATPRSAGTPVAPQTGGTPAANTPAVNPATRPAATAAAPAPAAGPATAAAPAPAAPAASAPAATAPAAGSSPAAGSAGTPLSAAPTTTVVPSPVVMPAG